MTDNWVRLSCRNCLAVWFKSEVDLAEEIMNNHYVSCPDCKQDDEIDKEWL